MTLFKQDLDRNRFDTDETREQCITRMQAIEKIKKRSSRKASNLLEIVYSDL